MAKSDITTGDKFHQLTAVEPSPSTTKHKKWLFRCECGNQKSIQAYNVVTGHTKTCGECHPNKGIGGHPLASTYTGILYRCYDTKCKEFPLYGGRGITVCDRWRSSFWNFVDDMGGKPTSKHSLDRIDNSGPYSPENCRWATQKEQCANKRGNVLITHKGETLTSSAWSERLGSKGVVQQRISKLGWSPEDAVSIPIKRKHS